MSKQNTKWRVELYKTHVIGFIEELLRKEGRVRDVYIFSLRNEHVPRKRWLLLVDIEEPFEYPSAEWERPGRYKLQ